WVPTLPRARLCLARLHERRLDGRPPPHRRAADAWRAAARALADLARDPARDRMACPRGLRGDRAPGGGHGRYGGPVATHLARIPALPTLPLLGIPPASPRAGLAQYPAPARDPPGAR